MTIRFNISIFLGLGTLVVFLNNCSSHFDNEYIDEYPSTDEQHLIQVLDQLKNSLNLDETGVEYAIDFYEKRNYRTIWVKDSVFKDVYFAQYINKEVKLNLPLNTLNSNSYSNIDNPYQKEVLTLLRLSEFLDIQSKGLINFKTTTINTHGFVNPIRLDEFLNSKKANTDWITHLLSFGFKNVRVPILHKALNDFTNRHPLNDKVIQVDKSDSLGSESNKIALNLKEKGLVKDITISRDSLTLIFKEFQYMNGLEPDGILGENSLTALHQSNLQRYHKGIIALEKLKSIPDSLISSKYIEVNIPSFLLHFYNDDTIVSVHRIVTGANITQTPEFVAPLKYIVTHPYWHVPHSIASTEIVYGAKRDSNFFDKRNYILTRNGVKVSPDSIDWKTISSKNFPFRVKQSSGPTNSLGLIKFLFPNEHAVYIHDTPAKYLFKKAERNFSHGCIRVEHPFKLAKHILYLEDHVYTDQLDILVKRKKETYISVTDRFLVHIRYRTTSIDDSTSQIRFHEDIYGREKKYMKLFESN